jgi:long-chain acyl-CoA synthetase
LHTGDIGSFDEEGFLTLRDRAKDVIISGGSNIYPREVEEVLLRHPGVLEVSVIGRPERYWGEEVVACVVPRPGQVVTEQELDAVCLKCDCSLQAATAPRFLDSLPKNNYGKVLKSLLRSSYG